MLSREGEDLHMPNTAFQFKLNGNVSWYLAGTMFIMLGIIVQRVAVHCTQSTSEADGVVITPNDS